MFHHHDLWECHRAGMYALRYADADAGAELARVLLADADGLWAAMSAVVREWPLSSEMQLSHVSQNRQAWLGQAACCFALGVPDDVTKQGWHQLTGVEQEAANQIADDVIAEWEADYALVGSLFSA